MSRQTKILLGVGALGVALIVIILIKRKKAATVAPSVGPSVESRKGAAHF